MPDGYSAALAVLLIGTVIVLIDGQLIMRHSPSYLAEVYRDPRRARQVAGLVALFFHLVMLGLVALIASGTSGDAGAPGMLRRIGVLLILTAVGHAVTVVILSRLRDQQTRDHRIRVPREEAAQSVPRGEVVQPVSQGESGPVTVRDPDGVLRTTDVGAEPRSAAPPPDADAAPVQPGRRAPRGRFTER